MKELNVWNEVQKTHPFIKNCYTKMHKDYQFLSFYDYSDKVIMFSMELMRIEIKFNQSLMMTRIKFKVRGDFGTWQKEYVTEVEVGEIVKCLSINKERKGTCENIIDKNLEENMRRWKKKDYLLTGLTWDLENVDFHVKYMADIIRKVKKSMDEYKMEKLKKGL